MLSRFSSNLKVQWRARPSVRRRYWKQNGVQRTARPPYHFHYRTAIAEIWPARMMQNGDG